MNQYKINNRMPTTLCLLFCFSKLHKKSATGYSSVSTRYRAEVPSGSPSRETSPGGTAFLVDLVLDMFVAWLSQYVHSPANSWLLFLYDLGVALNHAADDSDEGDKDDDLLIP